MARSTVLLPESIAGQDIGVFMGQDLGIPPVDDRIDRPYPGPAVAGINTYGLSGIFVHIVATEPPRAANRNECRPV